MTENHRLPAKTWQESTWSRALAILLEVKPVYVKPLYFTMSDQNVVFDPGSAMFYMIVWAEEEMMLDKFGEDYRENMERTGRFFPKL